MYSTTMTQPLPEHIRAKIEQAARDGVSFEIDRQAASRVTAIHWRPGDPNPLAGHIITHVRRPTRLVLDGHEYIITPVTGLTS